MKGYIYKLTDKRNGKIYIGKHNGKVKNYFTGGLIPTKIIKKYGYDIFERKILEDNIDSLDELNKKEKFYIIFYNSKNKEIGYNLTDGGDGGGEWIFLKTKEEREKISKKKSASGKGRILSQKTKKKLSKAHKGKKLSPEHKLKVIKNLFVNRVNKHSPETKEKLRQLRLGKKASAETKKKMSEKRKGVKRPDTSARLYIINHKSQKVSINGIEYKTIRYAAECLNMKEDTVRARINSKSNKYLNWFRVNSN